MMNYNNWLFPPANCMYIVVHRLDTCTDGGMWSTFLDDVEELQFFVPQLCRLVVV